MLQYREITPTDASIRKGASSRAVRVKHEMSVDDWIGQLAGHTDVDLTADHIAKIEAGEADLATASDWAIRAAEEAGIVRRV